MNIFDRRNFVMRMMDAKRWAELHEILKKSLDDPKNPESSDRLDMPAMSVPIGALNHLDFLTKHGERQGFWDDRKRFIAPCPEEFDTWVKGGCVGLWDQLALKVKA